MNWNVALPGRVGSDGRRWRRPRGALRRLRLRVPPEQKARNPENDQRGEDELSEPAARASTAAVAGRARAVGGASRGVRPSFAARTAIGLTRHASLLPLRDRGPQGCSGALENGSRSASSKARRPLP